MYALSSRVITLLEHCLPMWSNSFMLVKMARLVCMYENMSIWVYEYMSIGVYEYMSVWVYENITPYLLTCHLWHRIQQGTPQIESFSVGNVYIFTWCIIITSPGAESILIHTYIHTYNITYTHILIYSYTHTLVLHTGSKFHYSKTLAYILQHDSLAQWDSPTSVTSSSYILTENTNPEQK